MGRLSTRYGLPGNVHRTPDLWSKVYSYNSDHVSDGFQLKAGNSGSVDSNNSSFYTYAEYCGAYRNDVASSSYTDPVVDHSGSGGYLIWVIGPNTRTNSFQSGIKITIDGNEFEILSPFSLVYTRIGWGCFVHGGKSTNTSTGAADRAVGGYGFPGFNVGISQNKGWQYTTEPNIFYCPHPEEAKALGLPIIRFDNSLKVECKMGGSAAGPYGTERYVACSYMLD